MEQETVIETTEKTPKRGLLRGLQLWVVQSSVCVIVILLAVCLKCIGGNTYDECVRLFRSAMEDHSVFESPSPFVQTVAASGTESSGSSEVSSEETQDNPSPSFVAPLKDGALTSPYGPRQDPFDQTKTSFHYGIDIAAPLGTDLHALSCGKVAEVGEEAGYGRYVIVKVDETHAYLYAHCSEVYVKTGERVEADDVMAAVGSTGRSTGNHVHIEWRENGKTVDPSVVIPTQMYA